MKHVLAATIAAVLLTGCVGTSTRSVTLSEGLYSVDVPPVTMATSARNNPTIRVDGCGRLHIKTNPCWNGVPAKLMINWLDGGINGAFIVSNGTSEIPFFLTCDGTNIYLLTDSEEYTVTRNGSNTFLHGTR